MKTKHTLGEWNLKSLLQVRKGEKIIANIDPVLGDISEENIANAKLIAAAPSLLEEQITDIECIEDFISRYKKGETNQVVYFLENLLVSKRAVIKKATE